MKCPRSVDFDPELPRYPTGKLIKRLLQGSLLEGTPEPDPLSGAPQSSAAHTATLETMLDRGLTHIALPVSDLDKSLEFYSKYADMKVVHSRHQRELRHPGGVDQRQDPSLRDRPDRDGKGRSTRCARRPIWESAAPPGRRWTAWSPRRRARDERSSDPPTRPTPSATGR